MQKKEDPCLLTVQFEPGYRLALGTIAVRVRAHDGLPPYTYQWTGGDFVGDRPDFRYVAPFEAVSVEVWDNLGCVASAIYVNDPCANNNLRVFISQSTDAQLNVKLEAVVTGGFSPYTITWSTGENGYSIFVSQQGLYSVRVTDDKGCIKSNSFVVACKTGCLGCNGDTTITDNEGNVYSIVNINNRCWMAENLRTIAGISQVTDGSQWANLTTAAWCYQGNNSSNGATYGKLYNWYAVNTGNLCPSGWHIPTDAEWQNLVDYLGGNGAAGGAMKDTTGWNAPNTGATNSSGFTALPGGGRSFSGNFYGVGNAGDFWTSTENSADLTRAWSRGLLNSDSSANLYNTGKVYGLACRCVKD